jgi:uncharacterized protein YndB with AHSA1/START domain
MHLKKTYELSFPLEMVYDAWVSSDTVIPPATAMDVKPVVGGHYRLIMQTPEFNGNNHDVGWDSYMEGLTKLLGSP